MRARAPATIAALRASSTSCSSSATTHGNAHASAEILSSNSANWSLAEIRIRRDSALRIRSLASRRLSGGSMIAGSASRADAPPNAMTGPNTASVYIPILAE